MTSFIAMVGIGLIVPAFMRWYQRGSYQQLAPHSQGGGDFVMKPSRQHWIFVFGIIAAPALFGAFVSVTNPSDRGAAWVFFIMAALFAVFTLPTLLRSISVSVEGLKARSPWSGLKVVAWAEVTQAEYREWGHSIRIQTRRGSSIFVPSYLSGMKQLEHAVHIHVPTAGSTSAFQSLQKYCEGAL